MGVDVNLYAEGEVTDEQLATAETYLNARGYHGWTSDPNVNGPVLRREHAFDDEEGPRVEFRTLWRFYGPGYERGDWPRIYGAIIALRSALPHCRVFYGGDSTDNGTEATPEFLESVWAHWIGPEGTAYRDEIASWNADV